MFMRASQNVKINTVVLTKSLLLFQFAVLSNFTKDLQFHGGATVRVLDVETQKQFDEFCTVNYIESVHYEDQLCIKHGITVSEVIVKPSTPPTQPEDIETINDFIGNSATIYWL